MSVLNILFTPDRIDLLSDTLTYSRGEPYGLTDRKVHTADRFAWCTRGLCCLGDAFDRLAEACTNMDEAEVAGACWIEALSDSDLDGGKGIELTLAGYSARAGGLAVHQMSRERGKPVEAKTFAPGVYLLPTRQGMPPLPATVTERQFHKLALAQHAADKIGTGRGMDGMCIGGLAHQTTITRDGTSQRIAFLYPDYAETAAMFTDPNADEVAAFLSAQERVAA